MTWESQKHWSQRAHGAAPAVKEREKKPDKRKLMETVGERLNSCWRLDLHLTLAVVHYAAAVMITFVWSFFLSSLAAAAGQRAPDTRLHGCCSVWHITTEEHTGMRRRRTRQEWMSTVGKAEEMTKRRLENKRNSDAITGLCAKQTNGGVVTEQRREAL